MRARRAKSTSLPWGTTFRLAIRNILRFKGRTASVLAAVMFGTCGLLLSRGFIEDVFVQLGEAIVHSQSGHVQIAKGGYYAFGAHQPDKFLVSDPEGDKNRIRSLPEVEDVMARLGFSGLLSNGRADLAVLGEGIEPDREAKLSSFMRLSAGRRLAGTDQFAAIIGHGVAQALKLNVGDRVVLMVSTSDGAMNTLDLEIVGVFQTFSKDYDNRAIKIPLEAAQELLGTRSANTLVVSLKRTADTEQVAARLIERTMWRDQEVRTWYQLNDFYPKTVEMYRIQFGGLRLIILLMVVLGVVNAINSSVAERTAEFGTCRALGNRGAHIIRLILTESLVLGVVGSVLGVAVGMGIVYVVSKVGIPMPPPPNADLPYTAYIRVTPLSVVVSALIAASATVLAAIIPAIRVSRVSVVNALRESI